MTSYRTCSVPMCSSTSIKYPDKLFIHVPKFPKRRKQWLNLARRNSQFTTSEKSTIFFCEDHFDLPKDMENYTQYCIMGSVGKIRMKPDCLPSKFECQPDRIKHTAPLGLQSAVSKGQQMELIQELQVSNLDDMSAVHETADMKPENHECRACLQAIDSNNLLFEPWSPGWNGMENTVAEDLAKISNIQVSESDRHSKFICHICINQLKQACQFILLVQRNDKILRLRNTQGNDEEWPKPIQVDKSIACENFLEVDIKQEMLSDDEHSYNKEEEYTETEYIDQLLDIKVEPEEIVQPNLQININDVSSLQEVDNKNEKAHNGEAHYDDEFLNAKVKVKEEPMSETEDADIMPSDLPLECMLCTRSFSSMSGLKAHVIAQHSYKTVKRKVAGSSPQKLPKSKYMCAICKRIFTTSTDLMVHETCHNKDVCYGCNAKFDSFDKLSDHRKRCKALLSKETVKPKTLEDVIRPSAEESLKSNPLEGVVLQNEPLKETVLHNKPLNEVVSNNQSSNEVVIKNEPLTEEEIKNNGAPETLSCEMCNEQFSDSYYMKIHQEIHHPKETVDIDIKGPVPPMLEMDTLENIFMEDT